MFDDMITTAGTICSAAQLVRDKGAKSVRVGATHGVFAGPAVERLNEAPIDEIVIADTIPLSSEAQKLEKLKVVSVASLLGEAIIRIHQNRSVSAIFESY
jgi:ribose-phosphate pyrophosphokinase